MRHDGVRERTDGHCLNPVRPIHLTSCFPACTNPRATVPNGFPSVNADAIAYNDRTENRSSLARANTASHLSGANFALKESNPSKL